MGEVKVVGLTDIDNQPILEQTQPDTSKAGNTTDATVSFPSNQGVTTPKIEGNNISRSAVFDIGSLTEYIHIDGANRIIQSSNYVTGLSGWIIRGDGSVEFSDGVFRGSISATSGTIGGFEIGTDYIRDVANSFGLSSAVTGGNDPRFWAGTTLANIATAPVRIYEDGSMVATNIEATGAIYAESGWIGSPTSLVTEAQGINTGATGWIRGGQTGFNTGTGYFLGYHSGAYKISIGNGVTQYLTYDGVDLSLAGNLKILEFVTAGENIIAGQSLIIGDGGGKTTSQTTEDGGDSFTDTSWLGQTITVEKAIKITSIVLSLRNNNLGTHQVTASIRATSGGVPTGSDLGSQTVTLDASPAPHREYTFTFSSAIAVTPNTVYAIVLRNTSGDSTTSSAQRNSSSVYSGGVEVTSTNSGASWSTTTKDLFFKFTEVSTNAGEVYLSDASSGLATAFSSNFIGFAVADTSIGNSTPIQIEGSVTNQSGLSVGSSYYLSNTPGSINSSAGDISKKIGLSISATKLLILNS